MFSFVHKKNLEILVYPDIRHIIEFDENDEPWAETKNGLNENIDDYIEIEPMEAFKLCERFVSVFEDKSSQSKLTAA